MNSPAMTSFVDHIPHLFHVTRRSAVPAIQRFGLLPTSKLVDEASAGAPPVNRATWTSARTKGGDIAWLRWQRLPDAGLLKRLPDTITPAQWRAFINGMVFLFPSLPMAERLMSSPADRDVDQIILGFTTREISAAGCDLRVCRWNNGFLDRSKPPRIRDFADYQSATDWKKGDMVREVTVVGGLPPGMAFDVL